MIFTPVMHSELDNPSNIPDAMFNFCMKLG